MDLNLLRTFLEVSKTRHFGKAAQNLYLTQSTVSFRIKQLEEHVGIELFIRERNNIMLTIPGERLLSHAENILGVWQLALQDVGVVDTKELQLSLGGISNLWGTFLQSLLPKLAAEFKGVSIRTEISSHQELTRSLLIGGLDIAVVLDPPNTNELGILKIGHIELVMVCNQPGADLIDIEKLGYVFVDWGTVFNLQHAKLFKSNIIPTLHTENSQIALEYVISNGGAAFLPKAIVDKYINDSRLYLVDNIDSIRRDVFAVYSKISAQKKEIRTILNLLEKLELKPR
ncbi:MAG: LysR family transcriptional regulator [Oceanospirillaceae bacterium]